MQCCAKLSILCSICGTLCREFHFLQLSLPAVGLKNLSSDQERGVIRLFRHDETSLQCPLVYNKYQIHLVGWLLGYLELLLGWPTMAALSMGVLFARTVLTMKHWMAAVKRNKGKEGALIRTSLGEGENENDAWTHALF